MNNNKTSKEQEKSGHQHDDHCGEDCEKKTQHKEKMNVENDKGNFSIDNKQDEQVVGEEELNKNVKDAEQVSSDVKKNKGVAMVAYLIFFLPMLTAKDSKFAMYHANQALVLFLFTLGVNVLVTLMMYTAVARMLSPILGLMIIGFVIIGVVNANNGKMKELPLIGGIKILK